jgi:hypothetical protein
MKTETLYRKAINNGCSFETSCVHTTLNEWERLMKGATRANKILVTKIALLSGVIDDEQAAQEIKRPYFNPYNHYKTSTHVIYVHSSIEYFIRIF